MFAIAMKDLKRHLSNLNLLTRKNVICFKFLAQKRASSKQLVYYMTNTKILFEKSICLS